SATWTSPSRSNQRERMPASIRPRLGESEPIPPKWARLFLLSSYVQTERELLTDAADRLKKALVKGTGTSFDADEVQIFGRLLHAFSSVALGTAAGREACAVCGQAEHRVEAIGSFPPHAY